MKRIILAILLLVGFGALLLAQSPPASNANYAYITSATTTTVKAGPAFLHTISINTGGAAVITLYDIGSAGCSGTPASGKFATITQLATTPPVSLIYDLETKNGLCVLTSASTDVTISFN